MAKGFPAESRRELRGIALYIMISNFKSFFLHLPAMHRHRRKLGNRQEAVVPVGMVTSMAAFASKTERKHAQ